MLDVVWIRQSPVERVAQKGEDDPKDQAESKCQDSVPHWPGRAWASRFSCHAGDLDGCRNLCDRPKLRGVLQGDLLVDRGVVESLDALSQASRLAQELRP